MTDVPAYPHSGWAGGWCAVSSHTAPEELRHIALSRIYSSLTSPSEWDVMEGASGGDRSLQRDPLCFGRKQGHLWGVESLELLWVPKCSLPVPYITVQEVTRN